MNDLVMLAALLGGPAYGYALKRTAGLIFGNSALHNNVVYPSLKRFMRNGWVEQSSVPGDRGQQRKQYRITAAGKKYLLGQLASFGEREAADDGAFLFRVAFFDALPKTKREAIVAARKSFLASRAGQLSELREMGNPRSFGSVALERVQAVVENELLWIERLEHELEAKQGDFACKQMLAQRRTLPKS
jgi:DNA-binding PadR family transcriptional regulator